MFYILRKGWKYYSSFCAVCLLSLSNTFSTYLWVLFEAGLPLDYDYIFALLPVPLLFSFYLLIFLALPVDAFLRHKKHTRAWQYALAGALCVFPLLFWPVIAFLFGVSTVLAALFFKFFNVDKNFWLAFAFGFMHSAYAGFAIVTCLGAVAEFD